MGAVFAGRGCSEREEANSLPLSQLWPRARERGWAVRRRAGASCLCSPIRALRPSAGTSARRNGPRRAGRFAARRGSGRPVRCPQADTLGRPADGDRDADPGAGWLVRDPAAGTAAIRGWLRRGLDGGTGLDGRGLAGRARPQRVGRQRRAWRGGGACPGWDPGSVPRACESLSSVGGVLCRPHWRARTVQDAGRSARTFRTHGQEPAGRHVRPHDTRSGRCDRDRWWHDRGLGSAGPQSVARRRGATGPDWTRLRDGRDGLFRGEHSHCLRRPPGRAHVGDPGGHARPRPGLLTGRSHLGAHRDRGDALCYDRRPVGVVDSQLSPGRPGRRTQRRGPGCRHGPAQRHMGGHRAARPAGGGARSSSCQPAGGLRPDRSGVPGRASRDHSGRRPIPALGQDRGRHRQVGRRPAWPGHDRRGPAHGPERNPGQQCCLRRDR